MVRNHARDRLVGGRGVGWRLPGRGKSHLARGPHAQAERRAGHRG